MWTRWAGALAVSAVVASAALSAEPAPPAKPKPRPGTSIRAVATAYCQKGTTQSGTRARTGIVAADPAVLPVGSVVRLDGLADGLAGIYTVMDTGSAVKGPKIDIFVPDCGRAMQFGVRQVRVHVLRRGWDPKASAPTVER